MLVMAGWSRALMAAHKAFMAGDTKASAPRSFGLKMLDAITYSTTSEQLKT
jgi:hypothetical protein